MERGLTNFPKRHPQILVGVEPPCELVAVVEDAKEPKKMLRRDCRVYLLVL
jgi:hypothetical protein